MPTISQLPPATSVASSDAIPVSQDGTARAASIGTLLQSTQPAISVPSPSLLGRTSLGSGGPEAIDLGIGLGLSGGTLVANGTDHATYPSAARLLVDSDLVISDQGSPMLMKTSLLRGLFSAGQNVSIDSNGTISTSAGAAAPASILSPSSLGLLQVASAVSASDLIPISQEGISHAVTYANFLNGLTIDEAASAGPPADSDLIWTAQGTNVLASQSLSAIWVWIAAKLLTYQRPVIEITTNTNLSATAHNGRILVCSQPVTLTPYSANMGNGFQCQAINTSSGQLTLGAGFLTSNGNLMVGPQQAVVIQCVTYSGGTIVYALMPGDSATSIAPGQPTQLAASNIAAKSINITWVAPLGGVIPSSYVVQYRQTGSITWLNSIPVVTGTNYQLTGLQSNTSYDITVQALSGAGAGTPTPILTILTTAAIQALVPAQVASLVAVPISSTSIQLTWTNQTGLNAATSFTVQYRSTGSLTWSGSVTGILSANYKVAGLQAATGYDFAIIGVNTSGAGPASVAVSAATFVSSNAVSAITWNLVPNGSYTHSSGAIGVNAHVLPASAAVQFGFSLSSATPPASWTAGLLVNTDLWGAYVPTPSTVGSWYVWAEGTDGSSPVVYPTPFIVQ